MERVYVANLPPDIRIKDIDDFFRPFGKLVYIDVNHRATPVYAYVQFDSPRNAFNAVKARHGYDYEGYTLQLRLIENEVRKQRDATPPPPPPPMINNYGRQNINEGFSNNYNNRMNPNYSSSSSNSVWPSNNRSSMEQFLTNNRPNTIGQQNMNMNFSSSGNRPNTMPYSSGSRPNMEQTFSNTMRSNMQQFSNTSFSTMQQQYSNFDRSSTQQQHSTNNQSNMSHINFDNRPVITQQNMTPYPSVGFSNMQQFSNANSSNIPQLQKINIQCPDNSSWNIRNNGMNWTPGNFNNNSNNSYANAEANVTNNPNNNTYSTQEFEDKFTTGLSGAGRKWFNRFIRKGLSPEMARARALEHRRLPYLRGHSENNPIPNDPTNMALETIGNTIISILSTNPGDNTQVIPSNSMGRSSDHMSGTGSVGPPKAQGNAVSRRQYLKSLDILKIIKNKRIKSNKDQISLKYHTQIVKDYQKFNKDGLRNGSISSGNAISKSTTSTIQKPEKGYRPIISTRTEQQISELIIKQKAKLMKKARQLESETPNQKRRGGAFKKRIKILMDHGFLELEAKSLAWNPLNALEELLNLKREYDFLAKKTVFIPANKASLAKAPRSVVYRNDLQYLEEYAKHRMKGLSKTILCGLSDCLKRIHDYEKKEHLPLTENKFTQLLVKITSRENFSKNNNKTPARKKTNEKAAEIKKDVKESKPREIKKEADKVENQENATNKGNQINEDEEENEDQINEDIQDCEEEFVGNEEEFEDDENIESYEGNNQNENVEDQEAEE